MPQADSDSWRLGQPCAGLRWGPHSRQSYTGAGHVFLYATHQGFHREEVRNLVLRAFVSFIGGPQT